MNATVMLLPIADFSSLKVSFDSGSPAATPRETSDASVESLEATIRAQSEAVKKKLIASLADVKTEAGEDKDFGDSGDTTVHTDSKGVTIVKHHKSTSDDMPFMVFPITTVTLVFAWLIVRALMAPFTNRNKRGIPPQVYMEGLSAEEAALLEKLQRTIVQMESRVESLETILIDQARTKEKYGTKL